jgi:hypothetical protein
MTRTRRVSLLLLFAVALLVLGIIVLTRNRSLDDDLLAGGLLAAGLATVVVALPNGWH